MQFKRLFVIYLFAVASNTQAVAAFTTQSILWGAVAKTTSYSAPSNISAVSQPLRMALIDSDSIVMSSDHKKSFSDSIYPKEMGVTDVYGINNLPEDVQEKTMTFSFDKGSKVKKHSHPASGSYFVTKGSLKVTTSTESKTYKKGDFVVVPGEEEYELEEGGEGCEAFYVYWRPVCPTWGTYNIGHRCVMNILPFVGIARIYISMNAVSSTFVGITEVNESAKLLKDMIYANSRSPSHFTSYTS